jgi:guanosine-3',5'-bis(diphosphate) 3'-pyrophosphohydrolase
MSDPQITELINTVQSYNEDGDLSLIEKACEFAKHAHEGQTRSSGEPYYTHPLEVAQILANMKLDDASIITAVLHDTVEDTDVTLDDIKKQFSPEVASLVDGVTKLNQIESKTVEGKQAENFRKLVLAMSEDIRVLLVKLADRLHNMRTLNAVGKPHKRKRIARETIEIYAPLAERIGIHKIKEELQDLAFAELHTEARESISKRLTFLRSEGTDIVNRIINTLSGQANEAGITAEVSGREKTRFSIWKKMQRKNVAFEQLSDIMAFRIMVDTIEQCYHILGLIHSHYPTVPGRFKDYISTPKSNGYKSIHTTVIGPENQRIEIQIRTNFMHEEADLGVAAHWAYKQGKPTENTTGDMKKFRWLRELLEIIEQEAQAEDFLENTKLELFSEQVFCFTPKGDLIELPAGASSVDFAYAIHSDVGNKCVGAKINGRIAPLSTKLNNGDQVDIQTSKNQTPSPTWERFAATGKAKSHIRRFIRQQQRDQYMELGRAMVVKTFKQEGMDFTEKMLSGLSGQFRVDSVEDIITGVGQGNIVARDVFRAAMPNHQSDQQKRQIDRIENSIPSIEQFAQKSKVNKGGPMPIKGLIPGMAVHFARCCHPLPGDRIVGIVSTGRGVTVHTMDCDTLENFADTPERWLEVSWGDEHDSPESHVGRIVMTISNDTGALGTLSNVVSTNGGNITNLKITNRSLDFWDMYIDVYVEDVSHLNNIVAALRATPEIAEAERSRGR